MKKLLLATLGISTSSLLAITPEQQVELDKIFKERAEKIQNTNISDESKKISLEFLGREKKRS